MKTKLLKLLKDWLPKKGRYNDCYICQEDMKMIHDELKNLDDHEGVLISLHKIGRSETHIEHVGKMKHINLISDVRDLIKGETK